MWRAHELRTQLDERDGTVDDGLPDGCNPQTQLPLHPAVVDLQLRWHILAIGDFELWEALLQSTAFGSKSTSKPSCDGHAPMLDVKTLWHRKLRRGLRKAPVSTAHTLLMLPCS